MFILSCLAFTLIKGLLSGGNISANIQFLCVNKNQYENIGIYTCESGVKKNIGEKCYAFGGQAFACLYHRGREKIKIHKLGIGFDGFGKYRKSSQTVWRRGSFFKAGRNFRGGFH